MATASKDRLQQLQAASKLRYCHVEPTKVIKLIVPPKKKAKPPVKKVARKPVKTKPEINWDLVKKWAMRR